MTEREIFFEALEMTTPEARAAYLQGACGQDVSLRHKVEELLREHFSNDSLIAGPAVEAERNSAEAGIKEAPAAMVGRYKLLEKIGEGGFGEVWMAEQREPVKRRVALKIIKLGMDSRQVVARFEAERQALAMMDHANIAKIFDAGTTDSGRPYFVMELVRGIKVTEYCDQKELPTRERLDLFIKVCHAIQHAHQKGIIHRDVKPSNILVTLHDGVPVPKVIDFGIAKATQQELTDKTLFTQFQQFIGTPAYISPEQAEMSGLDIDTRADIYSLGVLLYELLVGQTPFDAREMIQGGLDALRRIIREKEPLRPSTKLNTLEGEARTTAGKRRQTDVGRLVHQLQGDLDWIVMKCLEKDRQRRYETANGLAADIQRHMNNEPVLARPPSKLYEFQKTVRRHKVGFAATAAIIVVLAGGVVTSTWQVIRATRATRAALVARQQADEARNNEAKLRTQAEVNEQKAQTEAARSAQVAQFMKDMLNGVGPSVALGRDTTLLREILDQTAQRLEELKDQPEVEADLRTTLGLVNRDINEYDAAESMLLGALTLQKQLHGEKSLQVANVLVRLGQVHHQSRKPEKAEADYRQALAIQEELLGHENLVVAETLNNLGSLLRVRSNKNSEAESTTREALAIRRKLLPADHVDISRSLLSLGLVLSRKNTGTAFAQAEQCQREALAMCIRLFPPDHPNIANARVELANTLRYEGNYAEAETNYRAALDIQRKVFGDQRETAITLGALGGLLARDGRNREAEQTFREALVIENKVFGESPDTAEKLVAVLFREGKHAEVEVLYREELEQHYSKLLNLWDRKSKANLPSTTMAQTLRNIGLAIFAVGNPEEAEAVCREALEIRKHRSGSESATFARDLKDLGVRIAQLPGRRADAEALLRESSEAAKKAGDYATQATAMTHLAAIVTNGSESLDLLREARKAQALRRGMADTGDSQALNSLAWELATAADPAARDGSNAVVCAEKAVALTSRTNASFLDTLAAAYAEFGQFDKAIATEKKAIQLLPTGNDNQHYVQRVSLYEASMPYRDHGALASHVNALLLADKFAEAEPLARECLRLREKLVPDKWSRFNAQSMLGRSLLGQNKYAEAESLLLAGYEGMKQRERSIPPAAKEQMKEAVERLVQLHEVTNRPEKAAEWNQTLAEFNQPKATK